MKHSVVFVVGLVVMAVPMAVAQETTGALQGHVATEVGTPIAGAAVEAVGPLGKVATTSDEAGKYRFPRLVPGTYTVAASFDGFLPVQSEEVRVILGEAVTVDITLPQGAFEDEILVYSDTVAIDFTESATATNIRQWEIDSLPRGRDFTDVVTYAPGTVLNYQGGGIMVDGASGLENRYTVDGLDTTSPNQGNSQIFMRAEFMEEVQVKSAGYTAEFGGSTGGVINAVTRSGSNAFRGSVFVDIENNEWNGAARPEVEFNLDDPGASLVTYAKDDEVRYDPGFALGGPILRDRLWFFGTYQPGIGTTDRTVNWVSYPPDTYRSDYRNDQATLNLTANVGGALLLKAAVTVSPEEVDGYLPNRDGRSGLPDQEDWAPVGWEWQGETYSLTADWIANDSVVLSARGGVYHTNYEETGIPIFDLIHVYSNYSHPGFLERYPEIPPEAQHDAGWRSNPTHSFFYYDTWERTAAGLDGSWFVSAGGDHVFKAGYQTEEITNQRKYRYNADRLFYFWDLPYTTTGAETVSGDYGYFMLRNQSNLGDEESRNQAVFVQDAWGVLPSLTLNIGVRAEAENLPNYGVTGPDPAVSFGWGDKVAPRLGFAWDVSNDGRWKLHGSWGTYYDVTKYTVTGLFGAYRWVDYYFTLDNANIFLNETSTCRTGGNTIFERPACPAGTFIEALDRVPNSADPALWEAIGYPLIEPDLRPMESWEAQIGVEHQLTPASRLGARYVHKEIVRAIEDVGVLIPGVGEYYVIGNPGEGITTGVGDLPYAPPVREYDGLELTFDRRFAGGWSLRAYYTLSRLWGNYSGLANSDENNGVGNPLNPQYSAGRLSPNVSRLYDVSASMYDANGDLVYGRLATDRTHQLGAQFLYSAAFGLSAGVTQYVGSGTPISTIGLIPPNNYFYPYGRGDLGETPWLTQTDLSLRFTQGLGKGLEFTVGLTVLNLFDEDTPTRKWARRNVTNLRVTEEDFLTGFDFEQKLEELVEEHGARVLDTRFGLWDTFQLPREVRLTLKLEF